MRLQFRCTNARLYLDPYREYCALGLTQCAFCDKADLRMVKVSAKQMIQDDKHREVYYDYTTGRDEVRGIWRIG